MSVRRLAAEQPASFEFTPDALAKAREWIARFPEGRAQSAVIPVSGWCRSRRAGCPSRR